MSHEDLDTLFLHDVYRRLLAGEQNAREDLLRRAEGRLNRLAHAMLQRFPQVRRWEETGDVLQAALLKLVRALDHVQPPTTRQFVGLAAEQLRRVLIDLARHYQGAEGLGAHHASAVLASSDRSEGPGLEAAETHEPPREELEAWCAFHEAVERLPVKEREVFSLAYYHGWNQSAIAELLQVSERTVRRFWRAACEQLREQLEGQLPVDS
ncbi:MAG: RNA polymerase sigma factor [Pirellulaceae bacterium]